MGDYKAKFKLADLYFNGIKLTKNKNKAFQLYDSATLLMYNNVPTEFFKEYYTPLKIMSDYHVYENNSTDYPLNFSWGMKLKVILATMGDPDDQYELGYLIRYNDKLIHDYNASDYWITKAFYQGIYKAERYFMLDWLNLTHLDNDENISTEIENSLEKENQIIINLRNDLEINKNELEKLKNQPKSKFDLATPIAINLRVIANIKMEQNLRNAEDRFEKLLNQLLKLTKYVQNNNFNNMTKNEKKNNISISKFIESSISKYIK